MKLEFNGRWGEWYKQYGAQWPVPPLQHLKGMDNVDGYVEVWPEVFEKTLASGWIARCEWCRDAGTKPCYDQWGWFQCITDPDTRSIAFSRFMPIVKVDDK